MSGPTDFVVREFVLRVDAEEMADAINMGGLYNAEVRGDGPYQVMLPGPCVPGTEAYVAGFLAGFYTAQTMAVMP